MIDHKTAASRASESYKRTSELVKVLNAGIVPEPSEVISIMGGMTAGEFMAKYPGKVLREIGE